MLEYLADRLQLEKHSTGIFKPGRWHRDWLLPTLQEYLGRRASEIALAQQAVLEANGDADERLLIREVMDSLISSRNRQQAQRRQGQDPRCLAEGAGQPLLMEPVEEACAQPEFVETVESLADTNMSEYPLETWNAVLCSRSALLIRFALRLDASLLRAHSLFGRLMAIKHERINLFARAQAQEPDGSILPRLLDWGWSEKQFELFSSRRYEELDLVSHTTGFLGPLSLREATPIKPVPTAQHYSVVSVVEGARDFFHATCTQAGYQDEPSDGFSVAAFFDLHIQNLRWARSQGDRFSEELVALVVRLFKDALKLAGVLARAKDESTDPAATSFTSFLPFHTPYVRVIKQRQEQMEPLRLLREALPSLLPTSTPRLLPGVSAEPLTRNGTSGGGGKAASSLGSRMASGMSATSVDRAKGEVHSQAKHPKPSKDSTRDALAPPGSRAQVAVRLSEDQLMLGGSVYDLTGLANYLGVKVDEKCWPFLLSSKTGQNRMSICPCHKQAGHRHPQDAQHILPPGFNAAKWDVAQLTKQFGRTPTQEEKQRREYVDPGANPAKPNKSAARYGKRPRAF